MFPDIFLRIIFVFPQGLSNHKPSLVLVTCTCRFQEGTSQSRQSLSRKFQQPPLSNQQSTIMSSTVITIAPPTKNFSISATPLTSAGFAPFGSVIQRPPVASNVGTTVNQGTAQKHLKVSPFTSAASPSGIPASFNINIFVCAPRELSGEHKNVFQCKILERHPYTSQSFIPLALDPDPENKTSSRFLVIVAPTLTSAQGNPPDLGNLKAFICNGSQGVTYAAGTWHAPMVALGEQPIEFVVLVHENGVEGEDTQEAVISENGIEVTVLAMGNGENGLWAKAKF